MEIGKQPWLPHSKRIEYGSKFFLPRGYIRKEGDLLKAWQMYRRMEASRVFESCCHGGVLRLTSSGISRG